MINAQSIKNKKDKLENLLLGFPCLPILGICETWMKPDESNNLFPLADQYSIYRCDREKGHGGVAILIPGSIPSMAVHKSVQCRDFETIWCRLVMKNKNVDIGILYRPPRPHNQSMPNKLIDHLKRNIDSRVPTVLAGDFNFSGIDWVNNTSSRQNGQNFFLDYINDSGLSQIVDFPTRKQNTLDLLFINEPHLLQCVELGPKVSDHETILYLT